MIKVIDLFSGIGGFSLGLERAGPFQTVQFVEQDDKARQVLSKHWPNVPQHDDIRTYQPTLGAADLVCGGFPCQDISSAGRGVGIIGERSGLWSEMARVIGAVRPQWVIAENVSALRSRGLTLVLQDLCSLGYDAEWHCIPASAVGAPHRRDRVWVIAYSRAGEVCDSPSAGLPYWAGKEVAEPSAEPESKRPSGDVAHPNSPRLEESGISRVCETTGVERPRPTSTRESWWSVEPGMGDLVDGLPADVDLLPLVDGYAILTAYGETTKRDLTEDLRVLQTNIHQETLCEWAAGGQEPIPKAEVLLAFLRQLEAGLSSGAADMALEGAETPETCLRELRVDGETPCTPHRHGYYQPKFEQSPDSLHTLSRLLACAAGEAWIEVCGEDAALAWAGLTVPRVAHKVPGRVDRLKQLGNSIVPQIATLLGQAILRREGY